MAVHFVSWILYDILVSSLANVFTMDAFEQLLGEAKCHECGKVSVV